MSCCSITISQFVQESVTTVAYSGQRPQVDVAYLQPDNSFTVVGIFTQIEITPTSVIIDHGGAATGLVKLLQ